MVYMVTRYLPECLLPSKQIDFFIYLPKYLGWVGSVGTKTKKIIIYRYYTYLPN